MNIVQKEAGIEISDKNKSDGYKIDHCQIHQQSGGNNSHSLAIATGKGYIRWQGLRTLVAMGALSTQWTLT